MVFPALATIGKYVAGDMLMDAAIDTVMPSGGDCAEYDNIIRQQQNQLNVYKQIVFMLVFFIIIIIFIAIFKKNKSNGGNFRYPYRY